MKIDKSEFLVEFIIILFEIIRILIDIRISWSRSFSTRNFLNRKYLMNYEKIPLESLESDFPNVEISLNGFISNWLRTHVWMYGSFVRKAIQDARQVTWSNSHYETALSRVLCPSPVGFAYNIRTILGSWYAS